MNHPIRLRRNPDPSLLDELRKRPKDVVPRGCYCYTRRPERDTNRTIGVDTCPFWDIDEGRPAQENGYCHLLQAGDWENREPSPLLYCSPEFTKETGLKAGDMVEGSFGLVWDQCKECGVNDEEERWMSEA